MGTSKSSEGPTGGVPLVPPHAERPDPNTSQIPPPTLPAPPPPPTQQLAPKGRFAGTRRALGQFASDGDKKYLRRALGSYVSKGYGGVAGATARQGHVVGSLGRLNDALSAAGTGGPADPFVNLDLSSANAEEVIEAVLDFAAPVDGSQDAELERQCMNDVLAEMLDENETMNLSSPTEEQRGEIVRRTLAQCVSKRFELDNGKHLREKTAMLSASIYSQRLTEVREFIREEVAARFRETVSGALPRARNEFDRMTNAVLNATFEVFESWLR